jgi:small subunit ribosomal protein S18
VASETTGTDSAAPAREASAREERPRGGPQRRYYPRRRVCAFCVDHVNQVDYKDVNTLERYVSDQGKIKGRRQTGNCGKHQHQVSRAIKRARQLALLPYAHNHHFTS